MNAEDTVMREEEMLGCSLIGKYAFRDVADVIEEVCKHQAEITWPIAYMEGELAGIKKVLEALERSRIQAQVKEWLEDAARKEVSKNEVH